MIKKIIKILPVLALLFSLSTVTVLAKDCGSLYSVGSCGAAGGCDAGSMCMSDGVWPWRWNFRCEVSSSCNAPITPPANTSGASCGRTRTVNGVTACFADDNTVIYADSSLTPAVSCTSENICCKSQALCPEVASTQPNGCGILTNGNTACRVNGKDVAIFDRCGTTQACCVGTALCPELPALNCGSSTEYQEQKCDCSSGLQTNGTKYCCGWALDNQCYKTEAEYTAALSANQGGGNTGGGGGGGGGGSFGNPTPSPTPDPTAPNIFAGPTSENFNSLNPLKNFSNQSANLSSPGAIVSRLLQFAFPLAGLILFAELVWGGFEMLIGATSKGIEAGKQRVTNALVGFLLLFVAYWIFQIVEVIFGVVIL